MWTLVLLSRRNFTGQTLCDAKPGLFQATFTPENLCTNFVRYKLDYYGSGFGRSLRFTTNPVASIQVSVVNLKAKLVSHYINDSSVGVFSSLHTLWWLSNTMEE